MDKPELYRAHILIPQKDGKVHQGLAGTFMIKDGHLHHLASYHDDAMAQAIPEGPVTTSTFASILAPPSHLKVAKRDDFGAGAHLDMIPEHELVQALPIQKPVVEAPAPERPPSVFHYHRSGMDRPHTLEVHKGQYLLDGSTLSHPEVLKILDNLKNRTATLRYRSGGTEEAVRKAEQVFRGLRKTDEEDMDPSAALAHLQGLGEDPKTAAAVKALRRHIYEDPMMTGLGNRYAWNEFAAKNQPGVYGSLDVNDLKSLNDSQGHEAGDKLIRAFGQGAREAADEAAPGHIKLFRTGGDEVVMHASAPEHAYAFLDKLRDKLDQVPPINGTHRVSISAGLGPDYTTADSALGLAKAGKLHSVDVPGAAPVRKYAPGHVPHLIHSLMPGAEGPVPQDMNVKLPEIKPPKEALPTAASVPAVSVPPATPPAPTVQSKK